MKRKSVGILLCVAMTTALAGCGSSQAPAASSGASASSAQTETGSVSASESAEAAGTAETTEIAAEAGSDLSGSLTIWEHNTSFETSLQGVIDGFKKKYPNIDVEYEF